MARYAIVVLDMKQRGLEDVWMATLHGLRMLGHDVELVSGPKFEAGRRAIVFGRTFAGIEYPKDAILYTLEYVGSPFFPSTELDVLLDHTVWDVEAENLTRLNVPAIHVPMGWVPQLETVSQNRDRDLDVVMLGSQHPRRIEAILECSKRGLKCIFAQGVYGEQKDGLFARAKLILNVHFYENNFEGPRIIHALINRRLVLSEETTHAMRKDWTAPSMYFVPYEDVPREAAGWIQVLAGHARQLEELGYEWIRARPAHRFLEEALDRTP